MSSLHSVSVTKGHTIMSTTKSTRVLRGAAAGAVCLALAFGTAGVALAGSRSHDRGYTNISPRDNGPQSNEASGVVSTLGTNSITLKGRHGTTTTYTTVPGTTTYFEGKTAGVATDLVVGDRVNLDLTTGSSPTVTKVTICLVRWTGTVTGVSSNVISITAFHNTSLSVDVTTGVTTYTLGGAASSLGAITTGAVISAVGVLGSSANTLDANSVNIFAPHVVTHVSGVVSTFGTNSITLKGRHGTTTTYTTVPGTTTYFEGKTAGVATDLVVGDRVNLDLTTGSSPTVTKVTICLVRWTGTVTGVSSNVISITAFHNTSLSVDVTTGVTTYTLGGAASSLGAITTGAVISAVGVLGSSANTLDANSVNIFAPHVVTHVSGVVSTLGTNSITLKGRHGTTTTYTTVPGTTTYFEGKTAGVATDLVVGDRVNLDLTTGSSPTVTKVTICLVRWTGTVTGVSSNVISITAFHNTSLSVDVTTGVTTYTLGGAASSLGAITTGAVISAVGVLGSSANTLDALTVSIGAGLLHGPFSPIGGPVKKLGGHHSPTGHGRI